MSVENKIVVFSIVTGSYIAGRLGESTDDETIVIHSPLEFREAMSPHGPVPQCISFGGHFLQLDPKEQTPVTFNRSQMISLPQQAPEKIVTIWKEATQRIETPPTGLVIAR